MRRTLSTLLAGTLLALPIAAPALASAPGRPACADQVDNDGDGLADFGGATGDPACTSPRDGDEAGGAVLWLQSPPDAGVEGRPPALTTVRHSVTVRNDGLVPQRVTLVQEHAFSPTPVPVIGGISAPSTTAGSCVTPATGAEVECDLGMVLPGESATVESTVTAICLPFPVMSFDVAVSTSVTGSPMRVTATADTSAATTTYHVACRPLGPPPPPFPLPF